MALRQLLDIDDGSIHESVVTAANITMGTIIGITVAVLGVIIVIVVIVVCCICKRRTAYGGTVYRQAPTVTTTTTYQMAPANTYPQPVVYPLPPGQVYYPSGHAPLPAGQAPPPYPGPPGPACPGVGYPQNYPPAAGGTSWQPPPQKLNSPCYPGMQESPLQKASAPPPEPY